MADSKASCSAATDPNGRRRQASSATQGECSTADPSAATKASESIASTSAMDGLPFRALSAMRREATRRPRAREASPAPAAASIAAPCPTPETVLERCDLLAGCSEEAGRLTRRFATPALDEARALVDGWMRDGGPRHPPRPARQPLRPPAGRRRARPHARLAHRHRPRRRPLRRPARRARRRSPARSACARRTLPFALEVAAFADEEGGRYGTGYLGSSVPAGRFEAALARARRRRRRDARRRGPRLGRRPGARSRPAPPPEELLGYAEVHIEQGPVLDDARPRGGRGHRRSPGRPARA